PAPPHVSPVSLHDALPIVDERDLRSETGEERGFLECRVATADDGDVLVAEEESITGGAPAHTVTGQLLLIGQTELAIGRTGRQDHCLGRVTGTQGSFDLM